MAFQFYLGDIMLPIPPSDITTKIKNQNETLTLINMEEVNILNGTGLTEIDFEILLPNQEYPFATYIDGFQDAKYYLDVFEKLKTSKEIFQFIIIRENLSYSTNIKVSLEEYEIEEDAKNGLDVVVAVSLKQYREFGIKTLKIETPTTTTTTSNTQTQTQTVTIEQPRETTNSPAPTSSQNYTVKSGDNLWNIAKYYYGDGRKYTVIFNANTDKIKNANLIYPGQVLTIPSL